MDEKKEIGKRIKRFRKEKRITQRQLADAIGCAEMTISQYERGLYSPKIDVRIAIAKALAVPYECLFVPSALSTNLAEVGTDCISRQQAISAICNACGKIDCDKMDKCEKLQLSPANISETPNSSDTISRQAAIDIVEFECGEWSGLAKTIAEEIKQLPSAQPEQHTCVNCGRTANNGGWYADGRTRCPIEEHYALPKDGYCHLWEKRNVTDDDYPERREE